VSTRLLISQSPGETRVALIEDGRTVEIEIEHRHERSGVGSLYLGRVVRVMPGMQAAFVDIGQPRAGFLYVGDISGEGSEGETRVEQVVRQGQSILVQVQKAPISTKGARLTCQLSLAGRHLVMMPSSEHVGISRRIESEPERDRLKEIVERRRSAPVGYIARTAAEGSSETELSKDMGFLDRLWADVRARLEGKTAPALVYEDLPLGERALRDMVGESECEVFVDDAGLAESLAAFGARLDPDGGYTVRHWDRKEGLFAHFGVEEEIGRCLARKVWLKSGGSIVIDQAEALTAIDINTGSYLGKSNPAETILRTNLEAIPEIVQQLRLRNIGGIIIIDFIDMLDPAHRDQVVATLESSLSGDRARHSVHGMSDLGLVEMTRKRVRESLGRQLSETCFYCDGRGALKSRLAIAFEIFREFAGRAASTQEPNLVVNVHPEVHDVIMDQLPEPLAELSEQLGKSLSVQPKGSYHLEQYDLYATRG
jgi:ribonuclease G